MIDSEVTRAAFVEMLAESGTISDSKWLAAFHDIPRGAFVPYYFAQTPERTGWKLVESPNVEWSAGVYSRQALITQFNGDDRLTEAARRGQEVTGVSTSSSSAPPLMALMLEALDVHDEHTVLEVGTGTGYNTALLCHRVGPDRVTSIDIDTRLVNDARTRLATFDYWPCLTVADGTQGYRPNAPYDRLIATVGVASVPAAWIEQIRPGGVILLPLDRRNRGGLLVKLTVDAHNGAQGRFLPDFGGFMPVRAYYRHDAADRAFRDIDDGHSATRHTSLSADTITDEANPFEFFAALTISGGGWDYLGFIPDNSDPPETWIAQGDGSWVCHTTHPDGSHIVRQGGPTRLWDRIETAHHQWNQLGHPTRDRFGLTVRNGQHTAWLDRADGPDQWDLPT